MHFEVVISWFQDRACWNLKSGLLGFVPEALEVLGSGD